jgi:hypothetical protein
MDASASLLAFAESQFTSLFTSFLVELNIEWLSHSRYDAWAPVSARKSETARRDFE